MENSENRFQLPQGIRLDALVCRNLEDAAQREWWLGNGRGGYAGGTVAGVRSRRYHGLLFVPLNPPLDRHLFVASADAILVLGDREWPLHTHHWRGGAVEPQGYRHLVGFHLDGRMPVWRYEVEGFLIESRIWLEQGRDVAYTAWRLIDAPAGVDTPRLRVNILADDRGHHQHTEAFSLRPKIRHQNGRLTVAFDRTRLYVCPVGGGIEPAEIWIENFFYPAEAARGLEALDNHLMVGVADLALETGVWSGLAFAPSPLEAPDLGASINAFRQHDREVLADLSPQAPPWIRQLALAADSFVVERPSADRPGGKTVLAGYPWFGDWGRDTFIALPGLTLATGRPRIARAILMRYLDFIDRGMVPNRFPDSGEPPEYNSVDAALWYIEAWREYLEWMRDPALLRRVFPFLEQIIEHYRKGARHGIRMDPQDGLIRAGEHGVQLTWMDAKVGNEVITPRIGKPVEINALWYNALSTMACFATRFSQTGEPYQGLAHRVLDGFKRFIRADGLGLYDVLDGPDGDDASIRPNQIFAVSLCHSPLDDDARRAVVDTCARHLECAWGLRTLSPEDPAYRGRYEGNVRERDGAYHQGTVWPWLLGHYILARHRIDGDAEAALRRLEPLQGHLSEAGLGSVSEIFDGDAPHRPRGAPSQAWSVAMPLQVWWRLTRTADTTCRTICREKT